MLVADAAAGVAVADEPLTMEEKQTIGKAIGRIASGVFVVTTERNGQRDGLLASWISQAAFDPPMVSVAVQKSRHLLELLGVGQRFTVNILSKDNGSMFKNFAKPYEPGCDRFEGLAVSVGKGGPVLTQSVAYLDCVTRAMVEAGDHVLVVGEIVNGEMLNPDAEPMIHLRKNGFQY